MKTSPTQRSLKLLREAGYTAGIVEKYNSFIKQRQDLFGFCDIVAFKASSGVLLVQTTTRTNQAARVSKILSNPIAREWVLSADREIIVHGWAKVGARGKRKLWECTVTPIEFGDFIAADSNSVASCAELDSAF